MPDDGLLILIFFFAFAFVVIFLLFWPLIEKKFNFLSDPAIEKIAAIIDDSIKRYRDHHKSVMEPSIYWSCTSRRYSFGISLSKLSGQYAITVTFHCKLPFRFQLEGGTDFHQMNDAASEMLKQKEISALIQPLNYFEFINVSNFGAAARKQFLLVSAMEHWHESLAALIKFVRYLIEYENRLTQYSGETICPYCRSKIGESDASVSCRECHTIHHRDCWDETGHCSVFGCGSKSEIVRV